MAEMGAAHRRDEMAVAEEEQPPPPLSDITDSVVDGVNGSNLNNINQDEKVETVVHKKQHSVLETKVTETKIQRFIVAGASDNSQSSGSEEVMKINDVGLEEDEEEEHESGVQVIEYEYKSGEQVIELDLAKFTKHDSHCPSCKHRITKVILRRKEKINPVVEYGLLIMFIYSCIEYVTTIYTTVYTTIYTTVTIRFKPPPSVNPDSNNTESSEEDNKDPIPTVVIEENGREENTTETGQGGEDKKPLPVVPSKVSPNKDIPAIPEETLDINTENTIYIPTAKSWLIRIDELEILNCIVYGGLIESITSLSVVTSVVATDATTLNVFAIGLALLFSGLIAFASNLMDLQDVNSEEKYRELLGNKENYIYHAILAILSYVVFGLIAPATYAFAFRESDNKDWKIVVVLIVALACILLLAIAKAYVIKEKDKVSSYVKTTRYYLIIAVSASGISYVVGYMIEMLMLKFGWFKSVQRVTCFVPENPNWTSY